MVLAVLASYNLSADSDSGFFLVGTSDFAGTFSLASLNKSFLDAQLSSLECSLKLLANQVFGIIHKLNGIELVLVAVFSSSYVLVSTLATDLNTDSNIVLDSLKVLSPLLLSVIIDTSVLSLSSSKVLTFKVGGLKLKLMAFEISIDSVLAKLDLLYAGSVPFANSSS
ncbi:hypothetical protein G9A89_009739 [Geosiphon pyriformis]|nr:hypothetical protein G9A89_009739 [Geosiphon pyriformis]